MKYTVDYATFEQEVQKWIDLGKINMATKEELLDIKSKLQTQLEKDLQSIFSQKYTEDTLVKIPDIYSVLNNHLKQYKELLLCIEKTTK